MARGSASSLSSSPQSQDGIATRSAVERAGVEPIAIIGIGCRFPGGAKSPAAFWQLLRDGVDAITPMPDERWALTQ